MKKKMLFLIMLFVSGFKPANAQSQFAGWLATFNSFKTGKQTSIHLDIQARSNDQVKHLSTFIFRPGINWHFRKNMIATAGYGYVQGRRNIGDYTGYLAEHRLWQQYIISHPISFASVAHRFRLEQRFIPKAVIEEGDIKSSGNFFSQRLRYFTRGVIPLNGQKAFTKGLFGAIQNEIFINLGDNLRLNGKTFDQNRFYLATGYRFSKKADLEAGYLNQYISGRDGSFTNVHVLQLAGYFRL